MGSACFAVTSASEVKIGLTIVIEAVVWHVGNDGLVTVINGNQIG